MIHSFRLYITGALLFASLAFAARPSDQESVRGCQDFYAALGQAVRVEFEAVGPRVFLAAADTGLREFDSLNELRVATYNVLNLEKMKGKFVFNKQSGRTEMVAPPREKPEWQLEGVTATIERENPDLLFLQEVEDFSAMERLVLDKLGGRYRPLLIEGNDERGIDVAVLVRKDLPLDLELQSYRNVTFPNPRRSGQEEALFSRDLPVLTVRRAGDPEPVATFMGTHFKSQRDAPGDDRSVLKRTAQAAEAGRIYTQLKQSRPKIPFFLLGDFNADVPTAPEFAPLWQAGFRDAFDLVGMKAADRVTHTFHPRNAPTSFSQMDAVAVAEGEAQGIVRSAKVVPYFDSEGRPKPLPQTYKERELNPSDHRMVSVVIDFRKVRESLKPRPPAGR